jgi:hypothetical protein
MGWDKALGKVCYLVLSRTAELILRSADLLVAETMMTCLVLQ